MGMSPFMRFPGWKSLIMAGNFRLHRPASNAADGNLEAGESHSTANWRNIRCISGGTALESHSETFSQLGQSSREPVRTACQRFDTNHGRWWAPFLENPDLRFSKNLNFFYFPFSAPLYGAREFIRFCHCVSIKVKRELTILNQSA